MSAEQRCEFCGCTEARACRGGCWWARPGLCSSCEAYLQVVLGTTKAMVRFALNGAIVTARYEGCGVPERWDEMAAGWDEMAAGYARLGARAARLLGLVQR